MTKANGECYSSYILNDVDDVLFISEEAGTILARLSKYFNLKSGSVGPPSNYLGTKLRLTRLPNSVVTWGMTP